MENPVHVNRETFTKLTQSPVLAANPHGANYALGVLDAAAEAGHADVPAVVLEGDGSITVIWFFDTRGLKLNFSTGGRIRPEIYYDDDTDEPPARMNTATAESEVATILAWAKAGRPA